MGNKIKSELSKVDVKQTFEIDFGRGGKMISSIEWIQCPYPSAVFMERVAVDGLSKLNTLGDMSARAMEGGDETMDLADEVLGK